MMNLIQKRIQDCNNSSLQTDVVFYDTQFSTSILEEIIANINEGTFRILDNRDFSNTEIDELVHYIKKLQFSQQIVLCWQPYKTALKMSYSLMCENFDMLWYPSSDDIWIVDSLKKFYLNITHEETLTLWERVKLAENT
jgi:hypothetical protein